MERRNISPLIPTSGRRGHGDTIGKHGGIERAARQAPQALAAGQDHDVHVVAGQKLAEIAGDYMNKAPKKKRKT